MQIVRTVCTRMTAFGLSFFRVRDCLMSLFTAGGVLTWERMVPGRLHAVTSHLVELKATLSQDPTRKREPLTARPHSARFVGTDVGVCEYQALWTAGVSTIVHEREPPGQSTMCYAYHHTHASTDVGGVSIPLQVLPRAVYPRTFTTTDFWDESFFNVSCAPGRLRYLPTRSPVLTYRMWYQAVARYRSPWRAGRYHAVPTSLRGRYEISCTDLAYGTTGTFPRIAFAYLDAEWSAQKFYGTTPYLPTRALREARH
eukprot:2136778-Rhodomonas_salina.1